MFALYNQSEKNTKAKRCLDKKVLLTCRSMLLQTVQTRMATHVDTWSCGAQAQEHVTNDSALTCPRILQRGK